METKKTHWKKNFNYNYIGAYSLNKGQELTLTINKVAKELVVGDKGQKEDCTVVYFKEDINGDKKPMILNKTNCKVIEKLYGTPYIEEWKGKLITIYVDPNIKAFGEIVEALRIKLIKPIERKPLLTPTHAKWNDAKKAVSNGNTDKDSIRKHWAISDENYELLCG